MTVSIVTSVVVIWAYDGLYTNYCGVIRDVYHSVFVERTCPSAALLPAVMPVIDIFRYRFCWLLNVDGVCWRHDGWNSLCIGPTVTSSHTHTAEHRIFLPLPTHPRCADRYNITQTGAASQL